MLGAAAATLLATAALGPSATEPDLRSAGTTPPWHAHARPSAWLVAALLTTCVVAGAGVLALLLAGRWRPSPSHLAAVGTLVAVTGALLPPIGSADSLSYASYGRMVVTGHDPWTTAPATLSSDDAVARAVEPPWQHEPAVYGPVGVGLMALAAEIGGGNPAHIILVLDLIGAAVFVGVGLLLLAAASDERTRRRRAAMWLANPLLWLQLVSGAHIDALVAAAAVMAVLVGVRHAASGGFVAAVGAAVKPAAAVAWLALAWRHRRDWSALARLAAAAAVVVLPSYVLAGAGAWRELHRAARRVSLATPWRPLIDATHEDRAVVGVLALVLAALLAIVLLRGVDRGSAAAVAAGLAIAYLLAAPYALPWYDALAWPLLALVVSSWRDGVLLVHTAVLSLAYLPGRDITLPGGLARLTHAVRTDVAPAALALLLIVVVGLSWREGRAAPAGSPRSP
jgi:hypothetical protein